MIDLNKEYEAFETEWKNLGGDFSCLFLGNDKMYHLKENTAVLTPTEKELLLRLINTSLAMWLIQAREKQAEIDDLKAQINALEESRMTWREYVMKIESGEFELVKKAEAEQAQADTKRIDFLADKSQSVANVMLPTEIVERNVSSLRDAIDQAMMIEESEDE